MSRCAAHDERRDHSSRRCVGRGSPEAWIFCDNAFAQIAYAYNEYGVIFFAISGSRPKQQVAFTRRFGAIEFNIFGERGSVPGCPEIVVVSNITDEFYRGKLGGFKIPKSVDFKRGNSAERLWQDHQKPRANLSNLSSSGDEPHRLDARPMRATLIFPKEIHDETHDASCHRHLARWCARRPGRYQHL